MQDFFNRSFVNTLLTHVETNIILTHLQHGFSSGGICASQLITTLQELDASYNQKTQIDVAILDLLKSFHMCPIADSWGN